VLSFDGMTRTGGEVGWLQHEDDGVSIAYQSKSTGAVKRSRKFSSVSTKGGLAISGALGVISVLHSLSLRSRRVVLPAKNFFPPVIFFSPLLRPNTGTRAN